MSGWVFLAVIAVSLIGGFLLSLWVRAERTRDVMAFEAARDADKTVKNLIDATRSRAGTRTDKMSDREALEEFEKNFGGPK